MLSQAGPAVARRAAEGSGAMSPNTIMTIIRRDNEKGAQIKPLTQAVVVALFRAVLLMVTSRYRKYQLFQDR